MDQLKPESLEWSLTHVLRFGDTDIFPVPFEYAAIKHCWTGVREKLAELDLDSYECRCQFRALIPKPEGGYRVAIQLDPIDTLIYTALVYEAAELIERQRIPQERRVACSYRVAIDSKGQFFRASNGWDDYHNASLELAQSGRYEYVVSADIADFYNQISHHRVRNALETAGVSPDRARNVENFLMNLTGGQSRGVPVGPSGSILLAEACLSDVDSFLLRQGYAHTRYVDDFRIFSSTRADAHRALHDLSEYLYTSHRLALQSAKTRLVRVTDLLANELLDPEKMEHQRKAEKINDVLLQLSYRVGYGGWIEFQEVTEDDLDPEELRRIVNANLVELFDDCLGRQPLQLGLVRYLLRRATRLDTAALQGRVLAKLETLAPVMRDVANYLLRTTPAKSAAGVVEILVHFLKTADLAFMSFLRLWIIEILMQKLSPDFEQSVHNICEDVRGQLGIRPFALLARRSRSIDWVRAQKETWQNHGPWDKRAVIWAATALSGDERAFWLKRVQNAGDILDNAVAKAALDDI